MYLAFTFMYIASPIKSMYKHVPLEDQSVKKWTIYSADT